MEATSGVAGIVSLGLTLTKGIIEYYSSYNDSKRSVKSLNDSAASLQRSLVLIKSHMEKVKTNAKIATELTRALLGCTDGLEHLERKLRKVKAVPKDDSAFSKAKVFKGKLSYPFRESTLIKLREECGDLKNSLQLVLQILQLDTASDADTQIGEIVKDVSDMAMSLKAVDRHTEDLKGNYLAAQQTQRHCEALRWFSSFGGEFKTQQRDIMDTKGLQNDGAAQILQTDEFQAWLRGDSTRLWCSGAPGVGKTVIASILINFLYQLELPKSIAYVYCSYQQKEKFTARNLVGSLIQQVGEQSIDARDLAFRFYERHQMDDTRPSLDQLTTLLHNMCQSTRASYILVDALDELPDDQHHRSDLLDKLTSLQSFVSIIILSRPLPDIETELHGWPKLKLEADANVVRRFLEDYLSNHRNLKKHFRTDPAFLPHVIESIIKKANGMFLLARMYVESITSQTTRRQIKTALQCLPPGLEGAYDQLMSRIQRQAPAHVQLARNVLMWTHRAIRPLEVDQLQEALSIKVSDEFLDDEDIPDEDLMISVCLGLIEVHEQHADNDFKRTRTISFTHYTAKEYFSSSSSSFLLGADHELARTCLTRLTMNSTHTRFKSYASMYWGDHARECNEKDLTAKAFEYLTDPTQKYFTIRQILHTPYMHEMEKHHGLYVAASFGLIEITKRLIDVTEDIDFKSTPSWKPLHWAVANNFINTVQLLLEHGSFIGIGDQSLQIAAMFGLDDIVLLLLSRGAEISLDDPGLKSPLSLAVSKGHTSTARILLKYGALEDEQGSWLQEAVGRAKSLGYTEVIELFPHLQVNISDDE